MQVFQLIIIIKYFQVFFQIFHVFRRHFQIFQGILKVFRGIFKYWAHDEFWRSHQQRRLLPSVLYLFIWQIVCPMCWLTIQLANVAFSIGGSGHSATKWPAFADNDDWRSMRISNVNHYSTWLLFISHTIGEWWNFANCLPCSFFFQEKKNKKQFRNSLRRRRPCLLLVLLIRRTIALINYSLSRRQFHSGCTLRSISWAAIKVARLCHAAHYWHDVSFIWITMIIPASIFVRHSALLLLLLLFRNFFLFSRHYFVKMFHFFFPFS